MAQAWERTAGTDAYVRRSRILLVGNDPDMRQCLTRLLGENYETDVAPDISTALDLSRKHMPDLVVADIAIRTHENFDVLWESRRTAWGKTPIILYSTREENSCAPAAELDANCDVIAPFSERQLLALVRAHLGMIQMRDKAIQSLRSAEDQFRTLKTMMTPGVWVAAPKGEIIGELAWWWEKLTGQTAEQYKGFGWLETVHPDDKPLLIQNLRDAMRKIEAYQLEYRVRRHDGSYSHVRSQGAPVLDGEDNLRGWIGTLTNIDEEKKAQEALRVSEERHRCFMAMTSLAVWTASPNGDLSNLRGWGELAGQTPDELRASWLEGIHPEDRTLLLEHWQRALREVTPLDVEFRVRQNDGAYAYVRSRGVPLRNPDGSVREWIGTLIDINARKKMEEALRASEERYRTLTTATTTGIWNATASGEIVDGYVGWENMTGQTPQQYKGWDGWTSSIPTTNTALCKSGETLCAVRRPSSSTSESGGETVRMVTYARRPRPFISPTGVSANGPAQSSTSTIKNRRKKRCAKAKKSYAPTSKCPASARFKQIRRRDGMSASTTGSAKWSAIPPTSC